MQQPQSLKLFERLTVFWGACSSYAFSCSQISVRWDAWFPEIHLKVLCDLAVLTEEVNGRDRSQSGYLAAALELWIPDSPPSSHLAGRRARRGLDSISLDKNDVGTWYCEFHIYMGMFRKEKKSPESICLLPCSSISLSSQGSPSHVQPFRAWAGFDLSAVGSATLPGQPLHPGLASVCSLTSLLYPCLAWLPFLL